MGLAPDGLRPRLMADAAGADLRLFELGWAAATRFVGSSASRRPADVVKATDYPLRKEQPERVAMSPVQHHAFPPISMRARVYRLTDGKGFPHAVLDECFESLDAALEAALEWIEPVSYTPFTPPKLLPVCSSRCARGIATKTSTKLSTDDEHIA